MRRRWISWTYTSDTSSSIQLRLFIGHREIPVGKLLKHLVTLFFPPLKKVAWYNNKGSCGCGREGEVPLDNLKKGRGFSRLGEEFLCSFLIHYTLIYYSHLRDLEGHSWYLRHEMLDLCFMYDKALSPVACPACISTDRRGLTPALPAESVISSWSQICLKIIWAF